MGRPDAYTYSYTLVVVFGILGNILVIISVLRQRRLLKNNYYFIVLHLAICDLGWLLALTFTYMQYEVFLGNERSEGGDIYCLFVVVRYFFHVTGVYMMFVISALRYRATVYPLNPDISERRLNMVCGLGYVLGLIAGYGSGVPLCFIQPNSLAYTVYKRCHFAFFIFLFYAPTAVMAVLYSKVYLALKNHEKYMKGLRSNPVTRSSSGSSFTAVNYIKNRRTFLVCVGTVLCYGVGNLLVSVRIILYIAGEYPLMDYPWLVYLGGVLRVAGSCSVNPLIYGIFDRQLLTVWKVCSKGTRR